MKIAICGSMQFYQGMRAVRKKLEALGHKVFVPTEAEEGQIPMDVVGSVTDQDKINAKIEYDFIREHFRKITQSEGILVLNYKKKGIPYYIGGNTFLEMGYAYGMGKQIYLMNPVPDMDYAVEMHAMEPIVVNGDLEKIL